MAITPMRGIGVGLPTTPGLTSTYNGPVFGNEIYLQGTQTYLIPAGQWMILPGNYTFIQILDPLTGLWKNLPASGGDTTFISSDGVNFRLANLTGTVVGTVVTNAGSGYTSAPTVTAAAGGGSYKAIVGGAISTTVTVGTAGAGYNYTPTVVISAPPVGGVQATAYATLSSGTVGSITVVDQGAGYLVAPTVYIIADPRDATAATPGPTTAAAATATLTGSGTITAVLATPGATALTAVTTLSFSGGGGSSAAATPVHCFSAGAMTAGTSGAGYGTQFQARTFNGLVTSTPAIKNPAIGPDLFTPRDAKLVGATSSGAIATAQLTAGTLLDAGLFQIVPFVTVDSNLATAASTIAAVTTAVGVSPVDLTIMQPM